MIIFHYELTVYTTCCFMCSISCVANIIINAVTLCGFLGNFLGNCRWADLLYVQTVGQHFEILLSVISVIIYMLCVATCRKGKELSYYIGYCRHPIIS